MKRFSFIILTLLIFAKTFAQSISVSNFKLLDTDLTANTAGTMEQDQNGETAALIKVVTTQTGFTFDGGALGIVKTVQKPSEIWAYVPRGLKKITISHPQFGVLRDYYFPVAIEAARTYEMNLVTGEVQTKVKEKRTSQYVVFQLTPTNAVVELDGDQLETTDGTATKFLKFGTYNYRVNAPNYLPEAGKVNINDPDNKHIINIVLKPNFSKVTLAVDNDAEIWVNGEKKGVGTWEGNLGSGTYEFETRKLNHRSVTITRDIIVTKEPQIINLPSPSPIYGEADINSTPALADIFIDGKVMGKTPMVISNLLIGKHQVKIRKEGYEDFSDFLQIKEEERCTYMAVLEKILKVRSFKIGAIEFKMIRVEEGSLSIKDKKRRKDKISLSTFYIGETEVTQELWKAIMGNNPSDYYNIGDKKPVDGVSWFDCQKFISLLNQRTNAKFRLPTEAEWEFAAQGGNDSYGYIYSGSNNIDEIAWYENNCKTTKEVKTKKPNELGLYDMSGNVQEWCNDWYGDNMNMDKDNPNGSVPYRVVRGGSFNLPASYHITTRRDSANPKIGVRSTGFRLVLSNE